MRKNPKGDWKANQFDWDRISSLSDVECCFSLSQKEVALILTYTEMIGYITRWFSETGQEIDISEPILWKSNLEYKLMSGCCPDDGQIGRYTEDGIYQTSDDSGITWMDNPDADPRNEWTAAPPLPGADGDSKKCAAADNAAAQFRVWADQLVEFLETATIAIGVLTAIVTLIAAVVFVSGVGAAWAGLLLSLAAALFGLGSGEFNDAMTEEVYEDFRCILYCNVGEDGKFSEENIVAILEEIATKFDGIVEHFFFSIVSTMRGVGMSNIATMGTSTAEDCGDCECDEACPEKYEIWDAVFPGSPYGTIVGTGDNYIDASPGPEGYMILKATDINNCCWVADVDMISGDYIFAGWLACGVDFSGSFNGTSPVGNCCSFIQVQASVGSVIRITLAECP